MTPSRLRFLIGLALVAATLVVYRPVCNYAFVNLDDPDYVQDNPLLCSDPVRAFTTIHAGYWIPLTWISYQLDYQFYGLAPGRYHRTNLLLHAANSLVLFLLLCRLTGATLPSGFAAALFALHPLQVESVAWLTERKDVLSTFFGLLALHAYARYVERPSIRRYVPVLIWLTFGLLAKPMLVTLPCVMLLLDYWPLNRRARRASDGNREASPQDSGLRTQDSVPSTQYSILSTQSSVLNPQYSGPGTQYSVLSTRYSALGASSPSLVRRASKLVLEKLPLFALALAACIVTVIAQRHDNAVRSLDEFPLAARLGNALVSYISYLEKIFWPFDLAVFYPHPGMPPAWQMVGSATVLAAITALILWRARRQPYLLVGWLWFAGTLLPVSGVLQAGWQGMADRFLYVPSIGLFLLLAFALGDLLSSSIYKLRFPLALLVLVFLSLLTSVQISHWRDSLTLWEHTRRVTTDNFYARFSYGAALLDAGYVEEAVEHFVRAVELKPDHPFGHYELGVARRQQGRMDEAIACWTTALRLAPDYVEAQLALADAQARHEE